MFVNTAGPGHPVLSAALTIAGGTCAHFEPWCMSSVAACCAVMFHFVMHDTSNHKYTLTETSSGKLNTQTTCKLCCAFIILFNCCDKRREESACV